MSSSNVRTIVITGATSGLGRQAAHQLADAGHHLILVGRDPHRARTLQNELPHAVTLTADLATSDGIRAAARTIAVRTRHIDTLINNAGVMLPDRRLSSDGIELNFAVHHRAPHSLTGQLLPLLQRGDGRVVNVNSEGHRAALFNTGPIDIDFGDLNSENSYDPFIAYSRSKLANLHDGYELQRRHPDLTVVAVHPGMVRTDLGRHFPRLRVAAMHALSISAAKGAQPVTYLAGAADLVGGTYYDRFTPVSSSTASYDRTTAERLWRTVEPIDDVRR